MSWFEFIVILLATVLKALVQLAGWLICFSAAWSMGFVYGPTVETAGWYTLGWMVLFACIIKLGLYWLKCSLYWFDRVAYFRDWKDDLDREYCRGPSFYGRGGGFL